MTSLPPRVVLVTRATEYQGLLARHGTRSAAAFFLKGRGQNIDDVHARHHDVKGAEQRAAAEIPLSWRRAQVDRQDLDRFLFGPEDLVVCVGQDGLVANVAKYLAGQPVIGVNPSPSLFDGILVNHRPDQVARTFELCADQRAEIESRTLVEAETGDGQRLVALNEIFIGHQTHQSARYVLESAGIRERHSSSGLVVTTGTGATGWAHSISLQRERKLLLPAPTERKLTFFVREPWPSVRTGTDLAEGRVDDERPLTLISEMDGGGVLFGDGMESDRIGLPFGQSVTLRPATATLSLVHPEPTLRDRVMMKYRTGDDAVVGG